MTLLGEELVIDGQQIDANVAGSITAASLKRRIDGATRLDLSIYDPRMDILRSGALTRPGKPSKGQKQFREAAWDRFSAARLNLDGVSFRLAGGTFQYDATTRDTTVSFEDELSVLMRLQEKAVKVSRGQDTRAEFMRTLVRRTLAHADVPFNRSISARFFSPQAGQREPIAEPKDDDERQKGFAKGKKLHVKTETADSEQRDVLTRSLTLADALKSGERGTLALIVALIVESQCRMRPPGNPDDGPLQVIPSTAAGITPRIVYDPRTGSQHGAVTSDEAGKPIAPGNLDPHDLEGVVRVFLLRGYGGKGGAIKYASENPDAEIYEITQAVQASGAGAPTNGQANYGPWVEQAREILEAWGGSGQTHTIRESFEFRAGGRRNGSAQNYWDDSGDSAEEVRWRRLCDRNRVWFVPDEWLFERKPTIHITGEDGPEGLAAQGIIGIDTTGFDVGLPIAQILIRCFLPRWGGAPGATVELEDLGALDGRWLIAFNDMDLLAGPEITTLTLERPRPKKKEPAPKTNTVTLTETTPEAGSIRDAIVEAAKRAHNEKSRYQYQQLRPYPPTLFPDDKGGPPTPVWVDCSSFVTLCYKAGEADDPNGSGYNGQTTTGTLRANGKKTNDPQPGDIVHYTSPDHAAIFIGDGEAIGIGGSAGVRRHGVKDQPNRFLGYYSYDLGSGSGSGGGSQPATSAPSPAGGSGWHPDATRVEMENAGTFSPGAGHKIVHHTTEGSSIAGAESAYRTNRSAPHFTFDHDHDALHQHVAINRASRSLKHAAGTPETNKAWAIQIEHVGFAAQSGSWSATSYARIASLCRWIEEHADVPRTCTVTFEDGATRLSGSAFFDYEGHVGHCHVPGNDHTDPGGGFKIEDVI